MKPLNLDNRPCSPISSNCVIWQGPDIPCIKLCTGDTVSDIVAKLGAELCTIMDQLKVTNYDLTCLGISACPPEDFQALIQLLITKICELNGITPTEVKSSGCPDCVVSVAPCFVEGTQTTMQLVDYVQMIANRICSILDQIDIINNQITNLDIRVTVLENTPPPTFTLPSIDTGCLSEYLLAPYTNLTQAPIDTILNTLVNDSTIGYCALIAATDLPANILSAVATQCITGTDDSLANPGDTFSSAYGPYTGFGTWNDSPVTAADAINNLWIALCDMYNYLINGFPKTVVAAGTNVTVTSSVVGAVTTYTVNAGDPYDSGWKDIPFYDAIKGYGLAPLTVAGPKIRIVGRVVTINGLYPLPLATNNTGLTLVNNVDSWKTTNSPYIFRGSNGGYEKLATTARMESINPILPTVLRPDIFHYLNSVAHLMYRSLQVDPAGAPPELRPILQAFCPYFYITPTGKFGFGTAEEREGFGDVSLGFPGQLAESCSIYTAGDFVPNYAAYGSGYTGAVNNRTSPASVYAIPFDVDTRDGYQLGGFYAYFNNRYHLSKTTPMQDIIDAFNNL
jgi:hypothetical protein